MFILNRELVASSIIEVVVASVILLVTFMVTMEVLTRLSTTREESIFHMMVEMELRRCYRNCLNEPDNFVREYRWGEIKGEVAPYRGEVIQVTLKAFITNGARKIEYKYLVRDEKKIFTRLYTN